MTPHGQSWARIAGTAFMVLLAAAVSPAVSAAEGARISVLKGEFVAGGRRIWINGANTPWHSWNDFGGRFDARWWDAHFQSLHEHGVNATRVWLSCDGEVGMLIDGTGRVSGATPAFWRDLDTLFGIARRHRVYVTATLLSFDHLKDSHPDYRSWRNWLSSDRNIDSYVDNVVVPLVRRYGDNPYLWAIDLMNEPDWIHENREGGRIPWVRMQSYFARAARAVHANSAILVTVGTAMPKYNSDTAAGSQGNKVGDRALQARVGDTRARLDFYSVHYYDWCGENWGAAPYMSPEAYRLPVDKPNVIGEMPAKGTRGHTLREDYESCFRNGWQGAMAWTSDGVDEMGGMDELEPATRAFCDMHSEVVFPR